MFSENQKTILSCLAFILITSLVLSPAVGLGVAALAHCLDWQIGPGTLIFFALDGSVLLVAGAAFAFISFLQYVR